jgi:RNA polymerase sigma-70 factor (ECF subfamily)
MDDRIAISLLKQGDLNGLETLVFRYQVQAVHAAYLVVHDRAQAEDIAQGAFIKIAERINQFDEERPFAPWFFRIVVNDALKMAQKQKRNVPLEETQDKAAAHLAEWITDPYPSPELALEEKQVRENLLKAIHSLPLEQRAVIVMRYYLEMSEVDMTTKMDRPLSTIKWWLRDARKRLRLSLTSNSHKDNGSKE